MTTKQINSCCCKNIKCHPMLAVGTAIGATLVVSSIINPKIRKVTVPTCKFLVKQQFNLLAGLGILVLANYISNNSDDSIDFKK